MSFHISNPRQAKQMIGQDWLIAIPGPVPGAPRTGKLLDVLFEDSGVFISYQVTKKGELLFTQKRYPHSVVRPVLGKCPLKHLTKIPAQSYYEFLSSS